MKRRSLLVVAGTLAGVLGAGLLVPFGPVLADGDGKGGGKGGPAPKDGEKKDPKDTPAGRACAEAGAEFQAKKSQALVDRVRPKGKLYLALGAAGDSYAADQAKAVLDQWFKDKRELLLELKSVTDLTGRFKLTWRADGTDKQVEKTLCITLERKEKGGEFHLAKIEILQ